MFNFLASKLLFHDWLHFCIGQLRETRVIGYIVIEKRQWRVNNNLLVLFFSPIKVKFTQLQVFLALLDSKMKLETPDRNMSKPVTKIIRDRRTKIIPASFTGGKTNWRFIDYLKRSFQESVEFQYPLLKYYNLSESVVIKWESQFDFKKSYNGTRNRRNAFPSI